MKFLPSSRRPRPGRPVLACLTASMAALCAAPQVWAQTALPPAAAAASPSAVVARSGVVQETAPAPGRTPSPTLVTAAPKVENGALQQLTVGDVSTLRYAGVSRIALGNGSLVRATVVDDREIVLIAEAPGRTSMHIWLRNGRQITHEIEVQASRAGRVLAELQAMLAEFPGLSTRAVGDRLVVEGRHQNGESAQKLKRLAAQFPQILSLVADQPADADPLQLERMIQFDLRVVEVKRNALDQLGIKWANTANGPSFATNALLYSNTPWRPADSTGFPPVTTANPVRSFFGLATQLSSALQLLETRGDAWTLAEPRLSCRSGGSATFLAGGEIPIPVPQGNGSIGVQYKQYGVRVEFKPQADAQATVDSQLMVEVSQPDSRNSNGGFIAFTTSRSETQVRLKAGEPLVIAGLLRERAERTDYGVPGLGRLPLIGTLFGGRELTTEKTELFVIATPRVLSPGASDAAVETAAGLAEKQKQRVERELTPPPIQHGLPTPVETEPEGAH